LKFAVHHYLDLAQRSTRVWAIETIYTVLRSPTRGIPFDLLEPILDLLFSRILDCPLISDPPSALKVSDSQVMAMVRVYPSLTPDFFQFESDLGVLRLPPVHLLRFVRSLNYAFLTGRLDVRVSDSMTVDRSSHNLLIVLQRQPPSADLAHAIGNALRWIDPRVSLESGVADFLRSLLATAASAGGALAIIACLHESRFNRSAVTVTASDGDRFRALGLGALIGDFCARPLSAEHAHSVGLLFRCFRACDPCAPWATIASALLAHPAVLSARATPACPSFACAVADWAAAGGFDGDAFADAICARIADACHAGADADVAAYLTVLLPAIGGGPRDPG
jgi:hypothetical protein